MIENTVPKLNAAMPGSLFLKCPFCAISRESSDAIAAMALLKEDRWVPVCAYHASVISRTQYTGGTCNYPRDPVTVRGLDAPNADITSGTRAAQPTKD